MRVRFIVRNQAPRSVVPLGSVQVAPTLGWNLFLSPSTGAGTTGTGSPTGTPGGRNSEKKVPSCWKRSPLAPSVRFSRPGSAT